MLSLLTRSLLLALAASPAVLAAAPHNVTIKNGNSRVNYFPSTGVNAWQKWPNPGCLDSTGGMWTTSSGPAWPTISLTFTGTDIYVYGQFDDETSLPIYTVSVDGTSSPKLGSEGILHVDRCKPIFVKNGLSQSQHIVVFTLTSDRPSDMKDLAFDGFIYTTTDATDTAVASASTPSATSSSSGSNNGLTNIFGLSLSIPAIIGIVAGIVVLIMAVSIFAVRRRRANAVVQAASQQPTYQPPARPVSIEQPRPNTFYTPPPIPYVPPPPQPKPDFGYNMQPYQYNNAPQSTYQPPAMQPPWSPPPPTQMSYEPAPSPWNPNLYHAAADSNSHLLTSTTPSSPYMSSQGQPAAYFDPEPHHRQPSPGDSYAPAPSASPQPTVDYQAQPSHYPGPAPLTSHEVDAISQRVRNEIREGSLGGENVKSSYAPVTSRGDGSGSGSSRPDPAMFLPRNDEQPQRQGNQGQPPHSDAPPTYH